MFWIFSQVSRRTKLRQIPEKIRSKKHFAEAYRKNFLPLIKPFQTIFIGFIAARTSILPSSLWKSTVRPKSAPVSSAIILIL